MKIIDLREEFSEFENTPFTSKREEISHLQKKEKSILHHKLRLFSLLPQMAAQGIVWTGSTPPLPGIDMALAIRVPYAGGSETNYNTYYTTKNQPEVKKWQDKIEALNIKLKKIKDRIKDLTVRGSVYCFTGFRDDQLEAKIERQGGKIAASAVSNLDYLVAKDPYSNSGKMLKAKQNGAKIISKQELEDFLRD